MCGGKPRRQMHVASRNSYLRESPYCCGFFASLADRRIACLNILKRYLRDAADLPPQALMSDGVLEAKGGSSDSPNGNLFLQEACDVQVVETGPLWGNRRNCGR
jgi:hypothetical protein